MTEIKINERLSLISTAAFSSLIPGMIKEACVESFEDAVLAEKSGADRIELCADLACGGITPSWQLMRDVCKVLKIPVMVMIRPRSGNFVYSDEEIGQMKTDIDMAKNAGADGAVFGLLDTNNQIDHANTRTLAAYAQPLQVTFHKAIDLLQNPVEGVTTLTEIEGIKRVLSSGGKATAIEGCVTIREMIKAANEKITILVAGKVTRDNLFEIAAITGADEFHGRRIV